MGRLPPVITSGFFPISDSFVLVMGSSDFPQVAPLIVPLLPLLVLSLAIFSEPSLRGQYPTNPVSFPFNRWDIFSLSSDSGRAIFHTLTSAI